MLLKLIQLPSTIRTMLCRQLRCNTKSNDAWNV